MELSVGQMEHRGDDLGRCSVLSTCQGSILTVGCPRRSQVGIHSDKIFGTTRAQTALKRKIL